MIRNPYAIKKRKAPSSSLSDGIFKKLDRGDTVTVTEASVSDVEANSKTSTASASVSEDDCIPNDKGDVEQKDSSSLNNKERVTPCLNNDVHYGQRLPSQRLTFGSAVILTVPELYKEMHPSGSTSSQENTENDVSSSVCASVRVTGVVLHHHVHAIPDSLADDTVVSIVLGDPLIASSTTAIPQPTKERRSLVSFAPKPTHLSPPPPPPQQSNLDATTTAVAKADANCQTAKKPVPIFVYRKKTTSSSSLLPSSNARRLSFATAVTEHPVRRSVLRSSGLRRTTPPTLSSLDQLVQRLDIRNHSRPCVWILVRLNTTTVLGSMQVNDLITVFGEVRRRFSTDHASNDAIDAIHAAVEQVRRPRCEETEKECTDSSRPFSCLDFSFVEARIVRNANGTNMRLFTDALLARRQFLEF